MENIIFINSNDTITLREDYMPKGIVLNQQVTLYNSSAYNLTLPNSTNIEHITNNYVLEPKKSISFI